MRKTTATTGIPAEGGGKSADDRDVSTGASTPPTTSEAAEAAEASEAWESNDDQGEARDDDAVGSESRSDEGEISDGWDESGSSEPESAGQGTAEVSDPVDVAADAFTITPPRTDRPSFTRPPGMVPPPDYLDPDQAAQPEPGSLNGPGSGGAGLSGAGSSGAAAPIGAPTSGAGFVSGAAPVSSPPAGGVRMKPLDPSAAIGSARVNEAIRATRSAAGPRGPRRARLTVKRLDPWSVMKFSFAVSLVLFIVMIVAASVLYLALDAMGVFSTVNTTLADLIESGGGDGGETFRITASWVIGTAASLGAINVVLFTALATLGAFIYNVCADLVGGVEVTLAERD